MKIKDTMATIQGCSDCPFCVESHAQGANDIHCTFLKQWTSKTPSDYVLDGCPLKGGTITVKRKVLNPELKNDILNIWDDITKPW